MKHLILLVIVIFFITPTNAQTTCQPPTYAFNSITNVSGSGGVGSIYRFSNSLSGVNAFVVITKLQNATITNSNMDVVGSFALAWQPTIRFTSNRSVGDSSYIEYTVKFVEVGTGVSLNSIDNTPSKQGCLAMTVVDCDGPGNSNTYREMVKVSLPATPIGIKNSTINVTQDSRWINLISGPAQFSNIDTSDYPAMAQVNFPPDTKGFVIRVGATGAVTANLDRQFSFYFKSFTGLNFVLPVNLIDFNTVMQNNQDALVTWSTASEQGADRFDLFRSFDGVNYEQVGSIKSKGNSHNIVNYSFIDKGLFVNTAASKVFYKLKMVELSGVYEWSNIITLLPTSNSINKYIGVFPNPTSKLLNVDLTAFSSATININILDAYGKLIEHIVNPDLLKSQMLELDLSNYNNGLYFIQVTDNIEGKTSTVKFIKE